MPPPSDEALALMQTNTFSKLMGFQNLIPQFDGNSAVTARYFIDTINKLTLSARCTDEEKLLILKSRVRGDALTHLINSAELNNEISYENFTKLFLHFFDFKPTLAQRQFQFTNCKMQPAEGVKVFAARVGNTTLKFLGVIDTTRPEVKNIFEITRLAKFTEGLTPDLKKLVIIRDPQTFDEAVNYVQLLQSTEFIRGTSTYQ